MMSTTSPTNVGVRFSDLGLSAPTQGALDRARFVTPTPIQAQAIPLALKGQDVIGIAQTGTGKTLAFGLPLIERLLKQGGRGLIVLPTRELALQVDEAIQKLGRGLGLRTAVLIGGASMILQVQLLRMKPQIIIVTPGRLIDHLEQRTIDLRDVNTLILDEADRMLDMGFAPQMKKIFAAVPAERQTMLFSATLSPEIAAMTSAWMKTPARIEIARAGTTADHISQELFYVEKHDKMRLLYVLLQKHEGTFIVFSRTKHGAKRMTRQLRELNVSAAEIHANRSLSQRKEALDGFKRGRYRVLVATDIAARGIDVQGIGVVVNFDLPDQIEDYVHRIGRTGRAGLKGHAISFAARDQVRDVRSIERLIKTQIAVSQLPELPVLTFKPAPADEERSYGSRDSRAPRSFGGRSSGRSSFSAGRSFSPERASSSGERSFAPRQPSRPRPMAPAESAYVPASRPALFSRFDGRASAAPVAHAQPERPHRFASHGVTRGGRSSAPSRAGGRGRSSSVGRGRFGR